MNKRTILFSLLWLVLAVVIFYATMMMILYLNLFSWHINFDAPVFVLIVVETMSIIGCFILAKHTIGKIEIWFSLLISIALAVFGIGVLYDFYTETISSGFFSRTVLSPHWFRILISAIYLTAIISWFVYPYKNLKEISSHAKI